MLENFRLLRKDRRVFISYRRNESTGIADQLYQALDKRGFDVFIDTNGVPPAADFQETLWHRMSDCDVVVLLDTPGFRSSRWTVAELAQANATSIQILHLLWPNVDPDDTSAFSIFVKLEAHQFVDEHVQLDSREEKEDERAKLLKTIIEDLANKVESLRARALAARQRYLVDNFCDQATQAGAGTLVVSNRHVTMTLKRDGCDEEATIEVLTNVGLPSAQRCHDFDIEIQGNAAARTATWLIFDERGVMKSWRDHVIWLNGHLPISAFEVSSARKRIETLMGGGA